MNVATIIAGLSKKDHRVFKKLVIDCSSKLMFVAKIYTRNLEDAKDVLQDSFIIIFQKASGFVGTEEKAFIAWMKAIVRNTALNKYQRKYFSHENAQIENNPEPKVEPSVYSSINEKAIMNLVFDLPMGYRQVFALFAIEGFSHKEIAEQLGIKESTSRSQYVRARQILQKRILETTKLTAL